MSPDRSARSPGLLRDLPFRRIAVVLSGGGALAAYEVGVLRALEEAGLRPHVVSGASAGALNAVAWVAQGFRARALEGVWRRMSPGAIGIVGGSFAWRIGGFVVLTLGLVELILTWSGSVELVAGVLRREVSPRGGLASSALDLIAWGLVALFGLAMLRTTGQADALIARLATPPLAGRIRLAAAVALMIGSAAHLVTLAMGLPWPHRFSATLLLVALGVWLVNHPGPMGRRVRRVLFRLVPESSRPGVWGGAARRSLVERMMGEADRTLLIGDDPHVIIVALALDTGRVAHFVNGADPTPDFRARVESNLGEVITLHRPEEMLSAAVASSSIPVVFEPTVVRGRQYVDSVTFANHPLRAALDAGADAAVVVRMARSETPPPMKPFRHPVDVWGRFLDLSGWRDLQQELLALPSDWTQAGRPCRLCLVEPVEAFPWGVFSYSPRVSRELMARGRVDARRALERVGWVAAAGSS